MKDARPVRHSLVRSRLPVRQLTRLAMLFALAVVLMALEAIIPPIPSLPPGVKLGLSNTVVMYCLFYLGKKQALTLLGLKTLFVLLTRGSVAFLLSLSGGLLSMAVMAGMLSIRRWKPSCLMISVCAAIAHNMAQLVAASILLWNGMVFYYAPVLLLAGIFMGVLTGTILRVLMPAMKRITEGDCKH